MELRTLILIERRPREVSLRRCEVDTFLGTLRGIVDVVPVNRRGRYRLTARGYVGVMGTPHFRLVIRPKIPLVNVVHLLDPELPLGMTADRGRASRGTELLHFLAAQLVERMQHLASRGLHRSYVERSDAQAFLHGKLDLAAQLRDMPLRMDRFHCRYEDFTVDNVWNRIPKATAESLIRSPLIERPIRHALEHALVGFAEVPSLPIQHEDFDRLVFDGPVEPYRPVIDLCRMICFGLTPTAESGRAAAPTFLVNMEDVFERYLRRTLAERLALQSRYRIPSKQSFPLHRPVPGRSPLLLRPDMLVTEEGRPIRVLDAKWKVFDGAPDPDDLHQAITYGTALNVADIRLVYPGKKFSVERFSLLHSPMTLTLHTVCVVGEKEKCRRSLQKLIASIS